MPGVGRQICLASNAVYHHQRYTLLNDTLIHILGQIMLGWKLNNLRN